jgi:hypothetical protein
VLHVAVMKGDIPIIQLVLKCEEPLINKQDKDGNTALHLAVGSGRADIVQTLLFFYPDLTIVNKEGATVWYIAASHRQWRALQVLLQHESSLAQRSAQSKTAAECLLGLVDGLLLVEGNSSGDEEALRGICEKVWQVVEANPQIAKEMETLKAQYVFAYFVQSYIHNQHIMKYIGGLLHHLCA